MPDNWTYVAAAYLVSALAVGGYWQRLRQRRRAASTRPARRALRPS
jgi:hypothetical protein